MMRWREDPLKDRQGEQRVVRGFLWWPKSLMGEWRWFERACWVEEVMQVDVGGSYQWGYYKCYWIAVAWKD